MGSPKGEEALAVAESLLVDIEESRIDALTSIRRAVRLTRLTDDAEGAQWLLWELQGYPAAEDGQTIREDARTYATRRGGCLEQGIDADRTGEILGRSLTRWL